VRSPFDIAQLSILGFFEAVVAYRRALALVDQTIALARREQPDIAVLIDSWGFTIRVAQRLRRERPGMPIVKYVAPQVWASRPGRARTLARTVDHLLSIHAFEGPHFEREGLPVTFVGNSALAADLSQADGARFRRSAGVPEGAPLLLVAPGSRPAEVARLSEPFGAAVELLRRGRPDLQLVVPVAPTVAGQVREVVTAWPIRPLLVEEASERADAMKAADVAMACSGTLTTELAVAGCPMVVAYRLSAPTYAVLRLIIRTRYATLFNIAADAEVAPELIQGDCTGPKLATAVGARLDDPALRRRQREAQFAALELMGRGGPDPAEVAADAVLAVLNARA
jgi:lipid-A-disaccharide synthase